MLSAVAPPLLAAHHPLAAFVLREFFAPICHQDPARSFYLWDEPLGVCVRCFGIYAGAALGAWILALAPGLYISPGLPSPGQRAIRSFTGTRAVIRVAALNVIDVAAESAGGHGNLPAVRLLLGALLGMAIALPLLGKDYSSR